MLSLNLSRVTIVISNFKCGSLVFLVVARATSTRGRSDYSMVVDWIASENCGLIQNLIIANCSFDHDESVSSPAIQSRQQIYHQGLPPTCARLARKIASLSARSFRLIPRTLSNTTQQLHYTVPYCFFLVISAGSSSDIWISWRLLMCSADEGCCCVVGVLLVSRTVDSID